jgi:NADPH:quinone reductase-like Zn-dependent oxidoreductase
MRAVILEKIICTDDESKSPSKGEHYHLVLTDVAMPLPGKGEVLIRIQCCSVNRIDLIDSLSLSIKKFRVGGVVGHEVCGTIADFGEDCGKGFRLGEQVIAYLSEGGAYAEFVVIDERLLMKAPFGILPMTTLAAVPLAYILAYHVAFKVAQIEYGEVVLLHAGASSVGLAIIQLLTKKGIPVVATVRSHDKKLICEEYGASLVINVSETNGKYAKSIIEKFHQGCNVILDCVGSAYIQENFLSIERKGRIVYYNTMSGSEIKDSLFLTKLIESEITIQTTLLRNTSISYKESLIDILENKLHLLEEIRKGTYKVPLYNEPLPLERFVDAHRMIRTNENIGKIILLITSTGNAVEELQQELQCLYKKEYSAQHSPDSHKKRLS